MVLANKIRRMSKENELDVSKGKIIFTMAWV